MNCPRCKKRYNYNDYNRCRSCGFYKDCPKCNTSTETMKKSGNSLICANCKYEIGVD